MADLMLWMAKSAVEETLSMVRSTMEEEAGMDVRIVRDLEFIIREFEMMRWFLEMTEEKHTKNNVVSTMVNQVRDTAYDVMEFVSSIVPLLKSAPICFLGMFPACMALPAPMELVARKMNQIKARVEAVRQRYMRCKLVNDSGSTLVLHRAAASIAATDIVGKAREAALKRRIFDHLRNRLIAVQDNELQVISVCRAEGDHGITSIIRKAYDVPEICQKFTSRAWVKLVHPFNPHTFVWTLLTQFYASSCQVLEGTDISVDVAAKTKTAATLMKEVNLMKEFMQLVNKQRYLIVLEDLSTIADWDAIRVFLPDMKNGSRIVVSTQLLGIATLCTREPWEVTELNQFSADDSDCSFFKIKAHPEVPSDINYFHQNYIKGSQDGGDEINEVIDEILTQDNVSFRPQEILNIKRKVATAWLEESNLVGRQREFDKLNCRLRCDHGVTTVWGIPHVGKSYLTRSVYYSQMISGVGFNMYSWVDVPHPFNLTEFCWRLLLGFGSESVEAEETSVVGLMRSNDPMDECHKLLSQHTCLVVIDGLRSKEDWDLIEFAFLSRYTCCSTIVITNEANVATYCAMSKEAVINVTGLENDAALELLAKDTDETYKSPDWLELRKYFLTKCGGFPEVILHVRSNWDILQDNTAAAFMHTLETNPRFQNLSGLFAYIHSNISTCPDILRPCILGMPVFPAYHHIRRRRLGRRWIAQGYFRDTDVSSAEEDVEKFFSKLADQNIIQLVGSNSLNHNGVVVNGFFHEYISSRSIVFSLDGRSSLNAQHKGVQHLTIRSSWDRNRIVFESMDLSRLRSLTVFGAWKSFFISYYYEMRVLQVIDLENASDVTDDDLERIVRILRSLKFLSVRGCREITRLPISLDRLWLLQTLDVRNTSVVILSLAITKLQKLQYIRAGTAMPWDDGDTNTFASVSWLSKFRRRRIYGVMLPAGMGKLTALHTLGVVNVSAGGDAFLKELKNLTQLRKLGVVGINRRNSKEFCCAISGHIHLESLSVRLDRDSQHLFTCLDDISNPLKNLKSLKLHGDVHKLPAWIKRLDNLKKFDLEMIILTQEDIHVLAELPCINILRRLCVKPIEDGEVHFCWPEDDRRRPESPFSLAVLKIDCRSKLQVTFGEWVTVSVEVLQLQCSSRSSLSISGLEHLRNLMEVHIEGDYDESLKEDLQRQLSEHPGEVKPVLKVDRISDY